MQHTCTHTFLQSFFCKHQSCAKLSNLSSSNLNSSCWIEILVEQMVFLEAKNTSADRCFRRKLKLNFLGGSSFRGFWSWLWLFLLYSTCCKCCLFPKKILPVVVAVPCVLVALVVILVYTRNASTSNKTFRKARSWHHNLPSQHPLFCSGLVMEIPCRGF